MAIGFYGFWHNGDEKLIPVKENATPEILGMEAAKLCATYQDGYRLDRLADAVVTGLDPKEHPYVNGLMNMKRAANDNYVVNKAEMYENMDDLRREGLGDHEPDFGIIFDANHGTIHVMVGHQREQNPNHIVAEQPNERGFYEPRVIATLDVNQIVTAEQKEEIRKNNPHREETDVYMTPEEATEKIELAMCIYTEIDNADRLSRGEDTGMGMPDPEAFREIVEECGVNAGFVSGIMSVDVYDKAVSLAEELENSIGRDDDYMKTAMSL